MQSPAIVCLRVCYIPLLLMERAEKHADEWKCHMVDIIHREATDPEGVPALLAQGADLETLANRTEEVLRQFELAVGENMLALWPEQGELDRFRPVTAPQVRQQTHDCTCFWRFYMTTVCGIKVPAFGWTFLREWWRGTRHHMILCEYVTRYVEEPLGGCGMCGHPARALTQRQQCGFTALGNLATGLWLTHALGCDEEKALFRDWFEPVLCRMQWYWSEGRDGCALHPLPPSYED